MKLTVKEMEIVEILEKDSRIAINDLAKMVGLTAEETEQSIKKLEDNKIIVKYISIVDWTKVEEHP
ncbi:Lrp/AsnC family transcriptional regulator, partial [Butyricicoccus sp. 1XD8-22]